MIILLCILLRSVDGGVLRSGSNVLAHSFIIVNGMASFLSSFHLLKKITMSHFNKHCTGLQMYILCLPEKRNNYSLGFSLLNALNNLIKFCVIVINLSLSPPALARAVLRSAVLVQGSRKALGCCTRASPACCRPTCCHTRVRGRETMSYLFLKFCSN